MKQFGMEVYTIHSFIWVVRFTLLKICSNIFVLILFQIKYRLYLLLFNHELYHSASGTFQFWNIKIQNVFNSNFVLRVAQL